MGDVTKEKFALHLPVNEAVFLRMQVGRDMGDFIENVVVVRAEWYMAAGREHSVEREWVSVPADWWQYLRQRFWPRWAIDRWPVVTASAPVAVTVHRVCPHVDPDIGTHLEFLRARPTSRKSCPPGTGTG